MCGLPFHRDRAMTSAAASASTSGIGSGSPTYGRDVSETVHHRHRPSGRRHHGRRAYSSSAYSRSRRLWRDYLPCHLAGRPVEPNVNPSQTSENGVSAA
jgi:hypothetical protein